MIVAHGGAAGAATEVAVLLVPLVIFALFTLWARRHGPADEEEQGDAAEGQRPEGE